MRYFVVMRQNNGCDYTIGCGISIEELSAKNMDEAIEEVMDIPNWKEDFENVDDGDFEDTFHDYVADSGLGMIQDSNEMRINECTILEVSTEKDIMPIMIKKLKELYAYKNARLQKSADNAERIEYERLKKKFKGK